MIAPLAVVAVLASWAFPDGVVRVELFTEAATVWERKGASRTAGQHFFVVVLGHGEPSETVVVGVFYGCSYSHPPGAHFFGSIMIRDECTVIKVWVNARYDSGLGKAVSGFSIPNPPTCSFVG